MAHDDTHCDAIFCGAIEIAAPEERAAFIARACGPDGGLRLRIERLVDAHFQAGSFLEAPPASPTLSMAPDPQAEEIGTAIGPYRLLQQIGEGGMGTVFMAEQTQPVRRKVALKVIKPGMDSRQVIARFEAERQALAMMDHVNIARVLDAGATESGRPYFVMELVHGVPITRYCDDNQLNPRQRLELFVPVCRAIQHAHQKGIIHRDIKPSNVMVTLYDGNPAPKVIDFGVAKATEQQLTERTLFTQYGTLVGTLEYMSPEQAEMSALGVDTRSDIYSLGVLLYELLTGGTPLSHKRLKEAAYGEILRLIKEEEPPKPSTRLSETGEELASIAAQRHMEPAKLTKLMRGELDWIVMKCLEKDRNRRYETAKDVAADVLRYLNDEPVQGRSITMRQRMWRWYRRHVPLIAGTYTIFTFLICAVEFIAMYSIIPFLVRSPNASEILSGFGLMAITLLFCLEGVEMGIAAFRGKRRGLWMSLVAFLALCLTQCWWLSWSIGISREISADPVYSVTSLSLDTLKGRNVYIRNCVIGFNVLGIAWFFVGLVLQVHALCRRAADRNPDAWRGI